MSEWDDRFKNHAVHSVLAEILEKLRKAENLLETPQVIEAHGRLLRVMKYLKRELETVDPLLVTPDMLDPIHSHLTSMNPRLDNFLNNKKIGPLNNANGDADHVLENLRKLPGIKAPSEVEELVESVSEYRQSVSAFLDDLVKEKEQLKEQFKALSSRVGETETRSREQDTLIESQKARLDNAISDFQKQFSDAQAQRQEEANQHSQKRSEEYNAWRSGIEKKY